MFMNFNGIDVEIQGEFLPYWEGRGPSLTHPGDPPEGGYIDDGRVLVGGHDITDMLREEIVEKILEAAWEHWKKGEEP